MPLMALSLPGNVHAVYEEFNNIANLDFIPKDQIYEKIFGKPLPKASSGEIKDYMLQRAGYAADNLFQSIFLVIFAFIGIVLLIGSVILIHKKCFHRLPRKYKKHFISIKNKLMFNSILRSLLQSYLSLCVSCIVSITMSENVASTATGYTLLAFLILSPLLVICILKCQKYPLGHPRMKDTIGTLYLNVDTVGKPTALLFTPLFLARRLLFAAVAVAIKNPTIQVFATIYASLGLITFYVVVWPMTDTINNIMQLSNEVFFLGCFHFALVFTDYTPDPEQRHNIGFVYLGYAALVITANIVLIGHTIYKQCKQYYLKRKS